MHVRRLWRGRLGSCLEGQRIETMYFRQPSAEQTRRAAADRQHVERVHFSGCPLAGKREHGAVGREFAPGAGIGGNGDEKQAALAHKPGFGGFRCNLFRT